MLPPFRLHLALLGQVNSLSCRDAGWRQGGASHSLWVHGERSHQAKGLCRCQGAGASTPSGQQKSLGLLGGSLPARLRAWGWQKSQPGWEILGRGGDVASLSQGRVQVYNPRHVTRGPSLARQLGRRQITSHSAVVLALPFARQKRQVEHLWPRGVGTGSPWQAVGMASQRVASP